MGGDEEARSLRPLGMGGADPLLELSLVLPETDAPVSITSTIESAPDSISTIAQSPA
jgi:hypothetical protein